MLNEEITGTKEKSTIDLSAARNRPVLIIGVGSAGSRLLRNLHRLGHTHFHAFRSTKWPIAVDR